MLWSLFTATFSVRLVRFGVEQQLRAVTHSDSRRSRRKTSKKKVKTSKPTEPPWSKTRTFFQLSQAEQTPGGGETGGTNGTQVEGREWSQEAWSGAEFKINQETHEDDEDDEDDEEEPQQWPVTPVTVVIQSWQNVSASIAARQHSRFQTLYCPFSPC